MQTLWVPGNKAKGCQHPCSGTGVIPLMNLACFLQQEGIYWGLSHLVHIFLLP